MMGRDRGGEDREGPGQAMQGLGGPQEDLGLTSGRWEPGGLWAEEGT